MNPHILNTHFTPRDSLHSSLSLSRVAPHPPTALPPRRFWPSHPDLSAGLCNSATEYAASRSVWGSTRRRSAASFHLGKSPVACQAIVCVHYLGVEGGGGADQAPFAELRPRAARAVLTPINLLLCRTLRAPVRRKYPANENCLLFRISRWARMALIPQNLGGQL